MKLESLYLSRDSYGPNKDRYSGQLTFSNDRGKVELKLSPTISDKILSIVGDEIVTSAREIAYNLTHEVIKAIPGSSAPSLEGPKQQELSL